LQNVAFATFLGFTLVQFVFALAARSEAMLADCAAMSVDAVTYLFNFGAERLKHRDDTEEEKLLPPDVLHRRRKLQRLYLELFPPLISVVTLLAVTVVALRKAIETILKDNRDLENPPDVMIMLVFSALNLLLDAVNVTCFARAEQAHVMGLPTVVMQHHERGSSTEMTVLLEKHDENNDATASYSATDAEMSSNLSSNEDDDDDSTTSHELNLNMCSAWTVGSHFLGSVSFLDYLLTLRKTFAAYLRRYTSKYCCSFGSRIVHYMPRIPPTC
jgi:Co/Zn/Cd efflux system component